MAHHVNGRSKLMLALCAAVCFNCGLSLLPSGANGTGHTGAEVVVAPSGNFEYASKRGNDSIATFSINSATGMISFVGTTSSAGNVPWCFTIQPTAS